MKVVILAGGFGTRITEESQYRPKPMVEIGGMPIIWHIMKEFSYYGFYDFIICAGYKQHVIKEWFANYFLYKSDITFNFTQGNSFIVHKENVEPWKVTIVDTGLNTMTGGRIKRIARYTGEEAFFMTYGDGVSDINIKELLEFHKKHKKVATLTATNVNQRFGVLELTESMDVSSFKEKMADTNKINVGYMVLEPRIFDYIEGDETVFEKEPLEALARDNQLKAYVHEGFWQCMDTKREKDALEEMWENGNAPWKKWD